MSEHYEILEAAIDYVTISAMSNQVALVRSVANKLCSQRVRLGDVDKFSSALGYDGIQVGPVFFGVREDGRGLLRVSGPTAEQAFDELSGKEMHFTRLDIQMTIRRSGLLHNPFLAKTLMRESNRRRLANPTQNYSHVRMIDGNGRGDTVMVGSRASGKYARIYDKAAESKDERYDGCWRYEIEYKQHYADLVRDILRDTHNKPDVIVDLIVSQMDAWEIPACVSRETSLFVRGPASLPTDNERSLAWLRKQVLPTVIRLRDAGYGPEVDELLKGE
jgi:DNA relaxase NicK